MCIINTNWSWDDPQVSKNNICVIYCVNKMLVSYTNENRHLTFDSKILWIINNNIIETYKNWN